MTSLLKALNLNDRGIVSFVGAGGKTSLMYAIAHKQPMAACPSQPQTIRFGWIFEVKPQLQQKSIKAIFYQIISF